MLETHEKKVIYVTAAIGSLLLLITFLMIYPKYNSIVRVNQSITGARTQLELRYEKTKRLHRSQIKLSTVQQLVDEIYGRLLKKGEELQFILALEALAEKMQLKQSLVLGPAPRRIQKDLAAFTLDISATGGFQNLMEYLEALEKSQYPLTILYFNFAGVEEKLAAMPEAGVQRPITLTIKAEVYVQDKE